MKAIDNLRTHMKLMRDQGLTMVAMSTVNTHLDEIERELEKEYVPLPKDANGVPIHIGDMLDCGEVCRIEIAYDGDPRVYVQTSPNNPQLGLFFCKRMRHKPPTVEDVLFEFARFWSDEELTDIEHLQPHAAQTIAEFAAKLQLREEGE